MSWLIDRLGRRRVLLRCAVGYGVSLVALVVAAQLHAGALALVALAFLAGALLPPIAPTVRALLRDVFVDVRVRETAYALESVAQELVWISGPLVVALVISILSTSAALLLVAALGVGAFLGLLLCVAGAAGYTELIVQSERAYERAIYLDLTVLELRFQAISDTRPARRQPKGVRPL